MAARATWKGALRFSLVTIPIKVFPATESASSFSFNQLHDVCQTRVTQKKWCVKCAREVPTSEIVKGFEFETGRYVLLLAEELDAIQPPSTRVVDLVRVVDADALELRVVDRAYYLTPDGPLARAAYAVLRDALRGKVGIGKVALYGREYLVAVAPQGPALMLYTLHHAAELRAVEDLEELQDLLPGRRAEVLVARQLVAALTGPLDLTDYVDDYHEAVQQLIDAKIAGHEIVAPVAPEDVAPLTNLRHALVASLAAVSATKRKRA